MSPTGALHGGLEFEIASFLKESLKGKGHIMVGEVGIIISRKPLRVRAADVVYINKEALPKKPDGMLEVPPDLIVEIISKNNTTSEMNEKVKDYLSIGVKRVALVDPFTETVIFYQHAKKEVGYYHFDDEFELIDGVLVKLKEIA